MITIKSVEKGGIADRHGIKPGDYLISVNGKEVKDVLDYRFYMTERLVSLKIHRGAELFDVHIVKDEYEDIGLEGGSFLMDEKRSCKNGCVFCFIDQLPPGMRETLYFKDDDSRLSFLMGNYVTMTNMSLDDIDRIVKMKMSPINISVHTTNPELRCKMMKNRFAGDILEKMHRLAKGGIEMNCQIVLCRSLNDGDELIRTMSDLKALYPSVTSVSVVPSGLTKYREGLFKLEPFTKNECAAVIDCIEDFGKNCKKELGKRIFYAADEFYIKCERKLPDSDYYEDYPQIENGVGMITSMKDEFGDELSYLGDDYDIEKQRELSIATGYAAYDFILSLADRISQIAKNTKIHVYKIKNNFFGENITVAGLLCGCDIISQLKGKPLGDKLILPEVSLRHEKDMLLDNITPEMLKKELGVPVEFSPSDGAMFIRSVMC